MIVVDTNVVAYVLVPGILSAVARQARRRDHDWVAPRLWRSEFRNVLAREIRFGRLLLDHGLELMADALTLLDAGEYDVDSDDVLRLAARSRCTAYDCEFVALARALAVPLVTTDREVLAAFPDTALSLEAFAAA